MCILSGVFCFVHTCLLKGVQEINVTHLCLIVLSWIAVLGSVSTAGVCRYITHIYIFISWFGHLSSSLGFKLVPEFWKCCWFEMWESRGCGALVHCGLLCGRRRLVRRSDHLLFPQDIRNQGYSTPLCSGSAGECWLGGTGTGWAFPSSHQWLFGEDFTKDVQSSVFDSPPLLFYLCGK